jgi:hypothetical protein
MSSANQSRNMVQQPIFFNARLSSNTDTQNTGREGLAGSFWSKPYQIVFGYVPLGDNFMPHIPNKRYWQQFF